MSGLICQPGHFYAYNPFVTPKFFPTQSEFREWLRINHKKEDELFVGFFKVGTGKPSMTWNESVDHALCFGWIDGVRKRLSDDAYTIRFTPRRPNSVWSSVNIRKVEELEKKGLMRSAGLDAFAKRREDRSGIYAYENTREELSVEFEKRFRDNPMAWKNFRAQPDWYRRRATYFVMKAKQEKTRNSRLEKLILASEAGERI